MNKILKLNLPVTLLLLSLIVLVSSVPTSILVNTKDEKVNFKVKRSSNTDSSPSLESSSSVSSTKPNQNIDKKLNKKEESGIPVDLFLGSNHGIPAAGFKDESKSTPQKRGANSQLLYNDIFNTPSSSSSQLLGSYAQNGVWNDEIDPSYLYQDIQDFEDYPRNYYKTKPYDSLQNILNSENIYTEPVALPSLYPYKYYGDRKKRSNKKNSLYELGSNKRSSKLTPADMLALVALVEAGERSKQDSENEEENLNENDFSRLYEPSSLSSSYGSSQYFDDDGNFNEYNNNYNNGGNGASWVDSAIDYYGMPYNLDPLPRYEVFNDQRLGSKYYPTKRYMITKKKRSLGHFYNEPIAQPSISFSPPAELFGKNGQKKYQKYF